MSLVSCLLSLPQADRIFHQQQLGLPWTPPVDKEMKPRPLGQPAAAGTGAGTSTGEASTSGAGVLFLPPPVAVPPSFPSLPFFFFLWVVFVLFLSLSLVA